VGRRHTTGSSCTSAVRLSSNSCVPLVSSATPKSTSSRLMMTLSVLGAESESDVRSKIECSLTWPVNLSSDQHEL
jgi:hypothetical protein